MNLKSILLLLSVTCFAQQQSKKIHITYNVIKNGINTKEYLIADTNNALYSTEQVHINNKEALIQKDGTSNIDLKEKTVKINAMRYFTSLNKTNIYFVSTNPNKKKTIVAIDSVPKTKWTLLTSDKKTIAGYNCYKATANFRGSKIVAYYTTEIPIGFGPFKFKGLPGLILEVFNKNKKTHYWRATAITYPYTKNSGIIFDKKKYNTPIVSYKSLIISFRNKMDNATKRYLSGRPRGTNIRLTKTERMGIEKVYEWEQETKEN